MSTAVRIRRTSGKTNGELVCAMTKDAAPETVFTYEDLAKALEVDTETRYDRTAICGVVRQANRTLLKQYQRELRNVPGLGFRVVPAAEHMALASHRRSKADRQLSRGLLSLRHVRWGEMDENQRRAHEGTLMVMQGVYSAVAAIDNRQRRHERLIETLTSRVEAVEGRG